MSPFDTVRQFEQALCDYTGAKYAVTTTSCTSALMLAVAYHDPYNHIGWRNYTVELPKYTYVGVAMAVKHAGPFDLTFRDENWEPNGYYQLKPLPVWDYARWLSSGMYVPGQMQCVSFHPAKHLGLANGGGAILLDDPDAEQWLRRARFDGRQEGVPPTEDTFDVLGYHCYMSPATAAEGLTRLALLPKHNDPLPWDNYADLSKIALFQ